MRAIALSAAVVLCACGKSPERHAAPVQPNAYDQQLQSMSISARNLGIRNAIQDSGARCARVDRSARQQDYKSSAMWVAHCTDTGDFALFVTSQGYAQIIRCNNLGEGVPACRLPTESLGR